MAYVPNERYVWAGTGGGIGFVATTFLLDDWSLSHDITDVGPFWMYLAAGTLAGGVVGFVAASLRRKLTSED